MGNKRIYMGKTATHRSKDGVIAGSRRYRGPKKKKMKDER